MALHKEPSEQTANLIVPFGLYGVADGHQPMQLGTRHPHFVLPLTCGLVGMSAVGHKCLRTVDERSLGGHAYPQGIILMTAHKVGFIKAPCILKGVTAYQDKTRGDDTRAQQQGPEYVSRWAWMVQSRAVGQ